MITEIFMEAVFLTAIFAMMITAHVLLLHFAFRSDNGKDKGRR